MATDIPLSCSCGSMRGTAKAVAPERGNRIVCMCDDCQAYAHWLGQADTMLDAHGGTDVFQLAPAQVEISRGKTHLRCVRLSARGLFRWYAGCCRTPVGNTLGWAKMPFVGVPAPFMDHASDGRSRDEVLGPVLARVNARFAIGKPPADAHARAPLGLIVRSVRQLVRGFVQGGHSPSAFFDPNSGAPVVQPRILDPEERERLRAACGPK